MLKRKGAERRLEKGRGKEQSGRGVRGASSEFFKAFVYSNIILHFSLMT